MGKWKHGDIVSTEERNRGEGREMLESTVRLNFSLFPVPSTHIWLSAAQVIPL